VLHLGEVIKHLVGYMHSLNSAKPVMLTLSPIQCAPIDLTTPDAEAANAAAAAVGFGNQGLNRNDPTELCDWQALPWRRWVGEFPEISGPSPIGTADSTL
jgi:hypothetical protein